VADIDVSDEPDPRRGDAPVMAVEAPTTDGAPLERPEDVPDLLRRIQSAVAQLTGAPRSLWNGEIEPLDDPDVLHAADQAPDGVLHLSRKTAELLQEALTKAGQGSVDEEQVRAAQVAMQVVSWEFVRSAVPDDYTRGAAERAEVDRSVDAISDGTVDAFTQRIYNQILDRALPPDLATGCGRPSRRTPISGTRRPRRRSRPLSTRSGTRTPSRAKPCA
jgi:hypothetical protein